MSILALIGSNKSGPFEYPIKTPYDETRLIVDYPNIVPEQLMHQLLCCSEHRGVKTIRIGRTNAHFDKIEPCSEPDAVNYSIDSVNIEQLWLMEVVVTG